MKAEENAAYQKGYNAGRRRAVRDRAAEAKARADNRFWQKVFAAALQGAMINNGWSTDGKRWSSQSDYVRGCGQIANEALRVHGHRS